LRNGMKRQHVVSVMGLIAGKKWNS